ncbi:FAD-dependent monooxygenase [Streptomyces sp. NPDC039016]|uniref:FAD-dependent monooxygenase n=1 Tax=Streptomyces sp. NPDC039016 TaxID=3154330 RepID=UPI003408C51A
MTTPTPAPDTHVVVVGAGPVGLMLAGELQLGGAQVTVLEQRHAPTTQSRASTLHARTMDILHQRGLLKQLGTPPQGGPGHFGGMRLDLTSPSPHSGQWKVPQARTEALLAQWATDLGARILRGHRLVALTHTDDHVQADVLADGHHHTVRARYLIGCDGERSTVRELGGFAFPGHDATKELLRADIADLTIPDRRFERHRGGLAIASRGPGGITRVMVHRYGTPATPRTTDPTFEEVTTAWKHVTGEDLTHGRPIWLNAFGNTCRQADRYRNGPILLAGDAAHHQMPVGGQALNLGLHDAVNLGWKLAAHLRGTAHPDLLDSYHDERHPVGARILGNITAQALLLLGGPEVEPLRAVFGELLTLPQARTHLAAMISGLDHTYPPGPGHHRLVGTLVPYHHLHTTTETTDTFAPLQTGHGVLIDLTDDPALATCATPWTDGRVHLLRATVPPGTPPPAFTAALVRPDGHLAWADGTPSSLQTALHRWFGPPHPHAARH